MVNPELPSLVDARCRQYDGLASRIAATEQQKPRYSFSLHDGPGGVGVGRRTARGGGGRAGEAAAAPEDDLPQRGAEGASDAVGESSPIAWQGRDGGQERANYAMFLRELCDALGLQPPDPAGDPETNDYVFERVVKEPRRDGTVSSRRTDLYKRGSFVLEAKQSRQQMGGDKEVQGRRTCS